ncbi:small nuclear ribonucleoprotein polypeptide a [Cystoisospora suis]|uniref:Small nuclear ribonucleoprotein polypeptide a n=1 Tax=Cystoisospora suis TaxID=483139 RepID=A0A2C6KU09_9APIC|nr:small nuclear ribonucleoprotein polypeptide a [Cystoisospora suis]
MRLTVELILQSYQYINPAKDWTLSLRGCKIPVVENLGATQDHFECIDFTDNELLKLDNVPPLPRLRSLILCNNRISRIDPEAIQSIPGLTSLILTNNKIEVLSDLLPLFQAKNLERLSLVENPVCERAYYRLFVVYNLPKLRFLDFRRVTQQERLQAESVFKGEKGAKLSHEIAPPRKSHQGLEGSFGSSSITPDGGDSRKQKEGAGSAASAEQIERIKVAIAKATTMEEIARLENALKAGYIPDDILRGTSADSDSNREGQQQSQKRAS